MQIGRQVDRWIREEAEARDDPLARQLATMDRRLHEQAWLRGEVDEEDAPDNIDPDDWHNDAVNQLLDVPTQRVQSNDELLAQLDAAIDSRSPADPEGAEMSRRHQARRRELHETSSPDMRRRYGR
jgi:hypothetical protein